MQQLDYVFCPSRTCQSIRIAEGVSRGGEEELVRQQGTCPDGYLELGK